MIVVADTSPLVHLARIGELGLVRAAVGPVVVPRTVWTEILRPGMRSTVVMALTTAEWITVVDDPRLEDLGLDPGETAAILLAESMGAEALLMDERRGRRVAKARGIRVLGTPGILAGARRAGQLQHAAPLVAALRATVSGCRTRSLHSSSRASARFRDARDVKQASASAPPGCPPTSRPRPGSAPSHSRMSAPHLSRRLPASQARGARQSSSSSATPRSLMRA